MPYTWYDPVQPMLVPMPIDPRYYSIRGQDAKRRDGHFLLLLEAHFTDNFQMTIFVRNSGFERL